MEKFASRIGTLKFVPKSKSTSSSVSSELAVDNTHIPLKPAKSQEVAGEQVDRLTKHRSASLPGNQSSDEVVIINPLTNLLRNGSEVNAAALSAYLHQTRTRNKSPSIDSSGTNESDKVSLPAISEEEDEQECELTPSDISYIQSFIKEHGSPSQFQNEEEEQKILSFITTFHEQKKIIKTLDMVIREEIKVNKIGLLREESLGANLLKLYWFHFQGKEYLKTVIKPLIKAVSLEAKNKPLEIDQNRVEVDQVKKNLKKLLAITKDFMSDFFKSYDLFPPKFELVMKNFYAVLTESEGAKKSHLGLGYSEDALRLFGGFLMLRFICPAIVSPTKHDLAKEINIHTQRALVLISKILQSIANQVEFEGEKEPYMVQTNDFVLDTMPLMMAFLNTLMDEDRPRRVATEAKKIKKKREDTLSPSYSSNSLKKSISGSKPFFIFT